MVGWLGKRDHKDQSSRYRVIELDLGDASFHFFLSSIELRLDSQKRSHEAGLVDSLPKKFERTLRANNGIALSSFDQFFDFARVTRSREKP